MTIIMTMNIYINVQNIEDLNKVENKSGLINELLEKHFNTGVTKLVTSYSAKPGGPDTVTVPRVNDLRSDYTEKAADTSVGKSGKTPAAISEKCEGQHYMVRMDCGKLNCPWG